MAALIDRDIGLCWTRWIDRWVDIDVASSVNCPRACLTSPDTSFRFRVCGAVTSEIAITVSAASIAPAAPSKCPVAPLVLLTSNCDDGILYSSIVALERANRIALLSATSPIGVEVA